MAHFFGEQTRFYFSSFDFLLFNFWVCKKVLYLFILGAQLGEQVALSRNAAGCWVLWVSAQL